MDVAKQVDATLHWQGVHPSKFKGESLNRKRITIKDARDLHANQHPSLQSHLQSDALHRSLPHLRSHPRSARPAFVESRVRQMGGES